MICLLDTSSWYFFSLFFSSPGNFSWHTRHTGFRSNSKNLVLEQNKFYLSSQSLSLHSNFHVIQDSFYFQSKSASITMLHRLSYFHVKLGFTLFSCYTGLQKLVPIPNTIWPINSMTTNNFFKTNNNSWYFFTF